MKYLARIFFLTALVVCLFAGQAAASANSFVVVQPGEPGTTAEAQPVMDELARYLSEKTGKHITGKYFNELSSAITWIKNNHPAWGIVDLVFYKVYGNRFALESIASTLPSGNDFDQWRLLVPASGPDSPAELTGPVYGSMFYTPEAAKILFSPSAVPEKFNAEGTPKVLRWLRRTAGGRAAGVCLNRLQFSVAEALPSFSKLKVVYTSQKLENSPVVSFGKKSSTVDKISDVLLKMKDDPKAHDLLELLRTDGFAPSTGG
ncbi:PhnD/SsuA/transferrin family substrate-binding protein [Maridesulfovibrio bastinii]|uniref:PhnD/SsuA/transferrin family substrate-binding protein n=1 Tax=Maridesulfovibrio bastinii TaxID=47157 RepID=UPI0004248791|nr:PhnD/SsuA/transferrin family substrate-binding protein [Maridesulfovibrio bastinii]